MKNCLRILFQLVLLPLLLALAFGSSRARAAQVTVQAALSQGTAELGESVEYQIVINGARNGGTPREIQVPGLQIGYRGQSTNVQMINSSITMSLTHSYSVVPQQSGTFVIPAQTVEVDGQQYSTQAVTLIVNSGSGSGPASASGSGSGSGNAASGADAKLAYAELVIPKSKAYVGEVIPVELRLYVDARIRWQLQQLPAINGEGFTTQKLSQPIRNTVSKNGTTYDLITFKSSITPVKSGQLGLGPIDIECVAQIPQKRKRPRFAMDDFDSLFNDPMGMFTPTQPLNLRIDRGELTVAPLPPNAPKSFAGAVGSFSLTSKASPTKAKVGDPITLNIQISGRGNFDRVNAPKLMEESGWRSYPPSSKFKADDDIGISGSKSFEMAVIPEQPQNQVPLIEFSYFDPLTEKYITLHADRDPLSITPAQSSSPAQPQVANQNNSSPIPTAAPGNPSLSSQETKGGSGDSDIRYILTGPAKWNGSFEPIFASKSFWQLQAIPLLALLSFAAFRIRQARKANLSSQQAARLQQEKQRLLQSMKNPRIDLKTFLEFAIQYLQLETTRTLSGRTPSSIGAGEVCSSRSLPEPIREKIASLFRTHDEFRYAGTGTSPEPISKEKQAEMLQTLEEFEKHAA